MAKTLYHVIPSPYDPARGYRVTLKESYYNIKDDLERLEARTGVKPRDMSEAGIKFAVEEANAILGITGETDYYEYH